MADTGQRMIGTRKMTLLYFSMALTIGSSALYHFTQKQIPAGVNPIVSVIVTYVVSLILCLGLLYFVRPADGIWPAVRQLNWTSYALALSMIGLEVGYLLVYRSGWEFGLASVLVNVASTLILLPIALLVFRSRLSWINIAGILVCLVGLVMLNWKR
jgi:drug/metabolite transporter (DMT)-like permease